MPDRLPLPDKLGVIVVTRLDALGDIVLGTRLLNGLHARWPDARLELIVRPALVGVQSILPAWVTVVPFPFDPREPVSGREKLIAEQLRGFSDSRSIDLLIVGEFNRVWAGELFANRVGASRVVAFDGPTGLNATHQSISDALRKEFANDWTIVHAPAEQRESAKYAKFLEAFGIDPSSIEPAIEFDDAARAAAQSLWNDTGVDPAQSLILFPSSGEQGVRSLDADVWNRWITRLNESRPVILLGSDGDRPVLDTIESMAELKNIRRVIVPHHLPGVTAAFIDRCAAFIGMDTGPMHIAAALGKPTLAIFGGGHRAERFLPVGRRAAAVRMPIGCYGCDWLCPFDRRLCIKSIPEDALFDIGEQFVAGLGENVSVFEPRVFDIVAPPSVAEPYLGPVMRQHLQFLKLNHELIEHHAYLASVLSSQQASIDQLRATAAVLAEQNHQRIAASASAESAITALTVRNEARDEAISHLNRTISELTVQNQHRDQAIGHGHETLAAMTVQNQQRDAAIAELNRTIAEMTRQNEIRDQRIRKGNERLSLWARLRRLRKGDSPTA